MAEVAGGAEQLLAAAVLVQGLLELMADLRVRHQPLQIRPAYVRAPSRDPKSRAPGADARFLLSLRVSTQSLPLGDSSAALNSTGKGLLHLFAPAQGFRCTPIKAKPKILALPTSGLLRASSV
jgi:hypothetical protein